MINNPEAFVWWLNGFVELHGQPPTPEQWEVIKEHLALVFTKVTQKRPVWPASTVSIMPADDRGPTYCTKVEGGDSGRLCVAEPIPGNSLIRITDLISEGSICGTTESPPDLSEESDKPITMTDPVPEGHFLSISSDENGNQVLRHVSWADQLKESNVGKLFITISSAPSFTAKSYSYYPFHKDGPQEALLRSVGLTPHSNGVYLVVDNRLAPLETKYDHLTGSHDHLTMVGDWTGILNVGVGSPLVC